MEDRSATGNNGGGGSYSPATIEPAASSRRRAGAQKRKATSLSNIIPVSLNPSKRATREKAVSLIHPLVHHNGPLTRASKQTPGSALSDSHGAPVPLKVEVNDGAAATEEVDVGRKLEELEATLESEFEAIRSRDSNSHVVPSHCGWFSWTKTHSIEVRSLPSFFDGKSETRTPAAYLKIRNWMMRKFHADPSVLIEAKDLEDLKGVEAEARKEVFEFLEYWGLINFHPFLKLESVDVGGDEMEKSSSILSNLYHFETIPPVPSVTPKRVSVASPVSVSKLFESAMAEELAKAEGPSVEYHCNSCSADCSRKRYHCQKQADYDLCADCFSNGNFDSDMSSSDFILMEPPDAHGVSGGKWTDQETLLLLEGLEIFEDNWSEIAEHVATKTKAQCVLHFLQMPIEDSFIENDDDISKENEAATTIVDDTHTCKDASEPTDGNDNGKDDQLTTSGKEASKPDEGSESKLNDKSAAPEIGGKIITGEEASKSEISGKVTDNPASDESLAIKALTEAFDAIGYSRTPESRLSFADVANPVMALAGFLARFVGSDLATASARCSLKSIYYTSPGIHLATRHCFMLEDPPDELNDSSNNCTVAESDHEAQSDVHDHENSKVSNIPSASNENEIEMLKDQVGKNTEDALNDKESPDAPNNSSLQKNNRSIKARSSMKSNGSGSLAKELDTHSCPSKTTAESQERVIQDVKKEPNDPTQSGSSMTDALRAVDASANNGEMAFKEDGSSSTTRGRKESNAQTTDNAKDPSAVDNQSGDKETPGSHNLEDCHDNDRLKSAAVAALSAGVVKAKVFASQEEDIIRQLAAFVIEKQMHKLEMKLSYFHDMDNLLIRIREQLERSRQKLGHERAQIIASRLGLQSSSSKAAQPLSAQGIRPPLNFQSSVPRPFMSMNPLRPPLPRPMAALIPNLSSPSDAPMRRSNQEHFSSIGSK